MRKRKMRRIRKKEENINKMKIIKKNTKQTKEQ